MMVPGAYFRDETIWRGRMIEFACDLKATLYELGWCHVRRGFPAIGRAISGRGRGRMH
jgi:hypothetical protein